MGKQQQLAGDVPSEPNAIVRRYGNAIAKSPIDIKRGQAVLIDRHGRVLGRDAYKKLVLTIRLALSTTILSGAMLAINGAVIAGIAVYCAGMVPVIWGAYRSTTKLMAVELHALEGRLDEAQRQLDAVPHLRRRNAALYCYIAGSLASHRGDYATALTWWREALPRAKGLVRERLKLSIVKALALSGQIKEAKQTYEAVKLPPTADELIMGKTLAELVLALYDPASMLDADGLHERARKALEYSHTGVELAAIGWAFERIGEEDMAQLLAAEALSRVHYPYLATWWPALQQWLDRRAPNVDHSPDLPATDLAEGQ